jgi:chaperonin GroEL
LKAICFSGADKPEKASAPAGDPTGGMGGMDF